jgi:hypothetical protein
VGKAARRKIKPAGNEAITPAPRTPSDSEVIPKTDQKPEDKAARRAAIVTVSITAVLGLAGALGAAYITSHKDAPSGPGLQIASFDYIPEPPTIEIHGVINNPSDPSLTSQSVYVIARPEGPPPAQPMGQPHANELGAARTAQVESAPPDVWYHSAAVTMAVGSKTWTTTMTIHKGDGRRFNFQVITVPNCVAWGCRVENPGSVGPNEGGPPVERQHAYHEDRGGEKNPGRVNPRPSHPDVIIEKLITEEGPAIASSTSPVLPYAPPAK